MRSPIPDKVARVRTDISSYIFHFVNRSEKPSDTLRTILQSGTILGGVYPPADANTVCFTEAPLSEVIRADGVLDSLKYQRLSLWGIGFPKSYIFNQGGLPVIYQPRSQFASLGPSAQWRHVDFDLGRGIDFTWQREWRIQAKEFHFDAPHAILVIPDVEQFADQLWKVIVDIDNDHGETTYQFGLSRNWDFIPLEHVDISNDASIEVCKGDDFTSIVEEDYYRRLRFEGP